MGAKLVGAMQQRRVVGRISFMWLRKTRGCNAIVAPTLVCAEVHPIRRKM